MMGEAEGGRRKAERGKRRARGVVQPASTPGRERDEDWRAAGKPVASAAGRLQKAQTVKAEKPQRFTLLRNLPIVAALVLLPLGASILAGWFNGNQTLIDWGVRGGTVPPIGALALMLFALALLGRDRLGRRWAVVALLPGMAGGWGLIEWLMLHVGGADTGAASPAALGPVVALGFVLAGAALATAARGVPTPRSMYALAGAGGVVGAVGLAVVLGHATGLVAATNLGLERTIPVPAALGFVVLGVGLLALAVEERADHSGPVRWLPVPFMLGCVAATLVVWGAMVRRERAEDRAATDLRANAVVAALVAELDGVQKGLGRIATHESWGEECSARLRQGDAHGLAQDFPEVKRLEWFDAGARATRSWTRSGMVDRVTVDTPADPRGVALCERARAAGRIEALAPVTGADGRPTVVLCAPFGNGEGFVLAELDAETWAERGRQRLAEALPESVGIALGEIAIHGRIPPGGGAPADLDREYDVRGVKVRLALEAPDRAKQSWAVLGSGLVFTLLLGLIVDLAQKARWRQLQAERVAERLTAEDRERRKVAHDLKASEARLSLALEAGQVGIFDADLATGEATFSAGVGRLVGRSPAEVINRLSQWDGLVHPEDASAVRREFQRGPRPGFREVEYRVRNIAGEWRWILERAKAVAFGPDGAPRRIAGTFQDITPRRLAEEALRASQAEARKLAAVASLTDNWVVITDASGAVEWINDSFSSRMGCPVTEAVGRALTDLLPPPPGETIDFGPLREAFVRRLPAQVALATIARNARVFHVQGDIHPVPGERGEIVRYIAVFHDITARIGFEHGLREAKAQAEAATRAKSEFLASMSHEIRTPMNGVLGLARLLLESPLTAEQADWVRTIHESGDALLTIVNDILDFSKVESGRLELERYPFSPADCLEEALELFAVAAGAKRIELSYWIAPGVPETIVGDRVRLRQVLVNLVGNAVKFTPSGRVSVEARPGETDGQLVFTVTDSGIGIPPDKVETLFQPFSQIDASISRRYGGTGLGLAICQRLVLLMGGSIGVHSRPEGGSVFHFTIEAPAAPEPPGAVEPPQPSVGHRAAVIDDDPVAQRFIVQVLERSGYLVRCFDSLAAAREGLAGTQPPDLVVADHSLPDGEGFAAAALLRALYPKEPVPMVLTTVTSQVPPREELAAAGVRVFAVKPLRRQTLHDRIAAAVAPRAPADTPEPVAPAPAGPPALADRLPLRVLLAEDNPVNRKVALRLLERLGYRAVAVANGAEAVRAAVTGAFDLIFMDVQMPEVDGLEATRRIRAELPQELSQPVIVALTANAIAGDAELCRAAGMDDYVSKPVTPEAIYNAIVRRCGAGTDLTELAAGQPA